MISIILISGLLIIAPWIIRNYVQCNTLSIAGRSGVVLTTRANHNDMPWKEYKAFILYNAGSIQWIKHILIKNTDKSIIDNFAKRQYKRNALHEKLYLAKKLGLGLSKSCDSKDYNKLDSILVDNAKQRIINNFSKHLALVLPFAIRGSFPEKGLGFFKGNRHTLGYKKFNFDITMYNIHLSALNLLYISCFFGLFVSSIYFRKWRYVWFLLPSIYLFCFYAFFTHFRSRYSIPLIPIFVICTSIVGFNFCIIIKKISLKYLNIFRN